jgi:CheY-like chemotaxis protein
MKKIIIPDGLKDLLADKIYSLSRETIQIFTVTRSEEVLRLHSKERADLIILDMDSWGIEGGELCKTMREDDDLKKVSIVIVYSPEDPEIGRYNICGANALLEKPVDPGEFLSDIEGLMGIAGREALRELIKVSVRAETAGDFFFATSLNISTSGMLIQSDRVLAGGSMIRCSFYLDRKITLEGRIVRAVQEAEDLFHYGLRFSDPGPDTKALLEAFLNTEEKNPSGL